MPLSYRDVKDIYDTQVDAGAVQKSMPEWARDMNAQTGSTNFSEGLKDNWWRRWSTAADEHFFEPIAKYSTEPLARGVGSLFGPEGAERGARIGRSLPRTLLQTAPAAIAGVLAAPETGGASLALTAGALGTGSLFGAQTYAETGSGKAALLSGAVAAALPAVGGVGARTAERAFGEAWLPKFAGSQAAQIGTLQAQQYVESKQLGTEYDPLSPDFWAQQIPFTVYDLYHAGRPTPVKTETKYEPPKKPEETYVPPVPTEEQQATIEATLEKLADAYASPTARAQDKEAALTTALGVIGSPDKVIPLKSQKTDDMVTVTGWFKPLENGNLKMLVKSTQGVEPPEHGNLFLNENAQAQMTSNADGTTTVRLPKKFVNENVTSPFTHKDFGIDPNQMELPVQAQEWQGTLAPDEKRVLETSGVTSDKPELKSVAQDIESTESSILQAKRKVDVVPERAEEIPDYLISEQLFRPAVKTETGDVYVGYIHADADGKAQQKGQRTTEIGFVTNKGRFLTREQSAKEFGIAMAEDMNPDEQPLTEEELKVQPWDISQANERVFEPTKGAIEKSIRLGASPTQAVESVRLQRQTSDIDQQSTTLEALKVRAQRIAEGAQVAGTKASTLLDTKGRRVVAATEQEAQTIADAYAKDHPELKLRVTSRKTKTKRDWFVRVEGIKTVSLEAGEGRPLEEEVAGDPITVDNRPDVSLQDVLSKLNVAERIPETFAEYYDESLVPDEPVDAVRKARITLQLGGQGLDKVNSALRQADLIPFKDLRDMTTQMRELMQAADSFNQRYTNFSLGSDMPHDEELVRKIGVREGPTAVLNWFTKEKQQFGLAADLVEATMKAHDHEGLKIVVDPSQTMAFSRDDRTIHVGWLPSTAADMREWGLDFVHEYMHDVAREIHTRQDPAAVRFRSTLTGAMKALRNSSEIPLKVRRALTEDKAGAWYKDLVKTGDAQDYFKKYQTEVGDEHSDWLHVFYGLTNRDEMLAQIFGSPKLVDLMRRTKMPQQAQTVLQFFSQVWGKLFGYKVDSENVFGEILQRFDNYLAGPRIRPIKEGIVRRAQPVYTGLNYVRDRLISDGVKPSALQSRIQAVDRLYRTGDLSKSIDAFQYESQNGLLPATYNKGDVHPEIATAVKTGAVKDVAARTLGLLMDDVPLHNDLWMRLKQDLDVAKDLYENIKKGFVPGEVSPKLTDRLREGYAKVNVMRDNLDRQAVAIDRFNNLDNFSPQGMERTLSQALESNRLPAPPDPVESNLRKVAQQVLGLAEGEPTDRTKISRSELESGRIATASKQLRYGFMFTQYLKGLVPEIRQTVDHTYQQQGAAFTRGTELKYVYNADPNTKEISQDIKRANERVTLTPSLARAASDIRLWEQQQERAGETPSLDAPFVQKILSRFNEKDRRDIITERNSALHRHDHYVQEIVPKFMTEKNLLMSARAIVAREVGMRTETGRALAKQMYDALGAFDQNPVAGQQALKELAARMSPDTFLKVLDLSRGLKQSSMDHLAFMQSRRHYVSEQRTKDHYVRMVTPDDKPFSASFDSKAAADKRVKELERQGYKFLEYVPKADLNVGGVSDDVVAKMHELDQQHMNMLQTALADKPELLETVWPHVQRAAEYEASKASFAPVPGAGFPGRKFIAGREELNMVENDHLFYNRANNWMRHQLMRESSSLDLLEPELLANRTLTKWARQHVDNFLANDSQLARKLSEFTYNWKLSWNFGVNFLHFIQSFNTGMASLISETGGVGDAFKYTTGAQKAVWGRMAKGKWANDDHGWLDRRASAEGTLGYATWEGDIGDQDRNLMYDASSSPWMKPVNTLKWAARSWNNWFFRYNDRVGLVAAFDLARERGMDHEQAFQFARDVKNRGYFTGGKAQRAIGQWSVKTKAVPQLMSSLQTYVQGWFSNLAYNYIRGFGKAPETLSAFERSAAKKAFLYQMGAQAVLAGALGLPGVGQGMALVKQTTGVDTMAWLRQHLADFFQEDQDGGGLMTNLALHGAVQSFTPVDPSSRHMPSVPYLGISPYKGFDIAQLAGAPVSSAADLVKGVMAAAKGDVEGASKILPEFLKGPFELFQGEGANVRDRAGNLITKMSPAERFVTALGMKPSRVTQLKDVNAAAKEASTRASREKTQRLQRIARSYTSDPVAARQELLEYAKENPQEQYASLVNTVAHHVADATIPYDYRRHVTPGADLLGLGSRQESSEVQRRQTIYGVQQGLGVLARPNPKADLEAEEVDTLLNSNPSMTRSQAVKQSRRGQPRRSALLDESLQ